MSKIIEYLELKQLHKKILKQLDSFMQGYKRIEVIMKDCCPSIQITSTISFDETKHLYKLIADILESAEIDRIIYEQVNQILTKKLEEVRIEAQKEIKEILGKDN